MPSTFMRIHSPSRFIIAFEHYSLMSFNVSINCVGSLPRIYSVRDSEFRPISFQLARIVRGQAVARRFWGGTLLICPRGKGEGREAWSDSEEAFCEIARGFEGKAFAALRTKVFGIRFRGPCTILIYRRFDEPARCPELLRERRGRMVTRVSVMLVRLDGDARTPLVTQRATDVLYMHTYCS